jgi:uncharacterized protein GlcG (DUF336 family)
MSRASSKYSAVAWFVALTACSGGGSSGGSVGTDPTPVSCSGNCATPTSLLTVADVEQVIAQAVFEATARNANATIAVVDRVGNVLGVYRFGATPLAGRNVLVATRPDGAGGSEIRGGLEGIVLPIDAAAAIAKAVTGAYLSSEGNAFSSRTASQIVQQNFNPGERDQPSGPLFGVQFSQLACSDFITAFNGLAPDAGPKRSPLGLSADPGGFPLYKDGTVVGGVGAIADDVYSVDADIVNVDNSIDEAVAYAATFGFSAPPDRRGDRITVDGKTLRFSDIDFGQLSSDPQNAPPFANLDPAKGALVAVNGYTTDPATINAGLAFGFPASGIRPDGGVDYPGTDAYVFVDDADTPRFPPIDGTDTATVGIDALTSSEVRTLLTSGLTVAARARAQIRRPLSSAARVTIAVVDTNGAVLGMVRSRDAPVFGADVSLQKARTAALFSSSTAGDFLDGLPNANYLVGGTSIAIGDYVTSLQTFLDDPGALENGVIAFTDRANGNLSRPFFPDGLEGRPNGPLSKPPGQWSPFSTGLQYDLVNNAVLQHVVFILGKGPDVGPNCTGAGTDPRIANGIQIFPGSVPIYRGETLVGGMGVSGDGVDQDDMVAFLGLHNGGLELGNAIGNAAPARRADTLTPHGVRLRYVQCPQAPFIDSTQTNVCEGK